MAMSRLKSLFWRSRSHQIKRVKYVLSLPLEAWRAARRFDNIKIKPWGDVYLASFDDGFQWCVPYQNKALVSWVRHFQEGLHRFEKRNLLCKGDFVVNVGACTGEYTIYAARAVGPEGLVYAFEPDPAHYRALTANMKLHEMKHVRCENAACGESAGVLVLHRISETLAGGSTDEFYKEQFAPRITESCNVPSVVLSEHLPVDRPIKAIVITVNNYELEVLKGAVAALPRTRFIIYQSIHHKEISEFLEAKGFVCLDAIYSGPPGENAEHIALFENARSAENRP